MSEINAKEQEKVHNIRKTYLAHKTEKAED